MTQATLEVSRPDLLLAARGEVRRAVTGQIAPALVDDCVLLTSEVVSSALVRGARHVAVDVQVLDRGVRVDVTSDRPTGPRHRLAAIQRGDMCATLLEAFSSDWGTASSSAHPEQNVVWFEMPRVTCRM